MQIENKIQIRVLIHFHYEILNELFDKLVCYCSTLLQVSNNFYFTFTVPSDSLRNGLKIRNVVPATEEEARHVMDVRDTFHP